MFDPLKSYKNSLSDPEAKKNYDEGYDRIFKKQEPEGEAKVK